MPNWRMLTAKLVSPPTLTRFEDREEIVWRVENERGVGTVRFIDRSDTCSITLSRMEVGTKVQIDGDLQGDELVCDTAVGFDLITYYWDTEFRDWGVDLMLTYGRYIAGAPASQNGP